MKIGLVVRIELQEQEKGKNIDSLPSLSPELHRRELESWLESGGRRRDIGGGGARDLHRVP